MGSWVGSYIGYCVKEFKMKQNKQNMSLLLKALADRYIHVYRTGSREVISTQFFVKKGIKNEA